MGLFRIPVGCEDELFTIVGKHGKAVEHIVVGDPLQAGPVQVESGFNVGFARFTSNGGGTVQRLTP